MRVNSDLLKHFEFLTIEFDGTRGFLYSTVSLISKSEVQVFPRGGGIFVVGSNWKNLCSNCLLWYNISMNLFYKEVSYRFSKAHFRGSLAIIQERFQVIEIWWKLGEGVVTKHPQEKIHLDIEIINGKGGGEGWLGCNTQPKGFFWKIVSLKFIVSYARLIS